LGLLPRGLGLLELRLAFRGKPDESLAAIGAASLSHPTFATHDGQCSRQGGAIDCQDFSQTALSDFPN
jgi:hypothetical protein